MRSLIGIGSVLLCLILPLAAAAKPLFTFTLGQGGTQPGTVSYLTYPLQFDATNYLENSIFITPRFTLSDVGTTTTITSQTDPNFDAFASKLVDGKAGLLTFWFVPAPAVNISGQTWPESQVVWGSAGDPRIDLHGQTIASISLHVDQLTVDNSGASSTFHSQITVSADDGTPVPEPASCVLGLVAGAWLLAHRPQASRRTLPRGRVA